MGALVDKRARGFLLLPVTLVLVAVGALAYSMTRDAGMGIASIDAAYDTESARYLAEAALNLARWKNYQQRCNSEVSFAPTPLYRYNLAGSGIGTAPADLVGTMTLNSVVRIKDNSSSEKGSITVDVTGLTREAPGAPGASRRIVRTVSRYDLDDLRVVAIRGTGGANTYISSAAPTTPQGTRDYLELTDDGANQSYGLVRFGLGTVPKNALVKEALFEVERYEGEPIFILFRRLDIHRVTSAWDQSSATWNTPWSKPGGDYAPNPVAGGYIIGNGIYGWRIDALAAGWVNGTLPNNGMLLKPTKLLNSRFRAFASGDPDVAKLTVTYYPRCT
jgi:hypothetical protein